MFFDNPMLFRPGSSGIAAPARAQDHHYAVRRASGNLSPRPSGSECEDLFLAGRFQVEDASCWPGTMKEQALRRQLQDHGVAAILVKYVC